MAVSFSSSELEALYAIYNATHGQTWEYTGNPWNFSQPSPDPCGEKWQGISCVTVCSEKNVSASGGSGSVSGESNKTSCENVVGQLQLEYMNLVGTLPEEIGNFPFMTVFEVISSPITLYGTVPASIGNLTSLQNLNFDDTSLSGPIPSSIGRLYNLSSLFLIFCQFTGTIPEELYHMTNLTDVDLAQNYLHGTLSPNISQLSNLLSFDVNKNMLSGNLPQFSCNWTAIQRLDLTENLFEGTIPDVWAIIPSPLLYSLSLYDNLLTGSLPTVWSRSFVLSYLDVSYNLLQGEIPIQLFQMPLLTDLYLDYNLLSNSLPSEVGDASFLQILSLSSNCLVGEIPSSMEYMRKLQLLYISDNYLTGTIPATLPSAPKLYSISANDNFLSGTLPSGMGRYILTLDVSSNLLTGNIPEDAFLSQQWQGLMIEDNLMTGTVQAGLCNMSGLLYLEMDNNLFYGTVPNQFSQIFHLEHLSLGNNLLTGSFQLSLYHMRYLFMLQLDANQFTGTLSFLPKGTHLQFLNISNNLFQGPTTNLSFISYATVLDISYNLLSDSLPSIASMPIIYTFFADSNCLEGSLGSFFSNSMHHNLQAVDVSSNQLTGRLPDYLSASYLTNISSFAAVQNCFTGTIPESFCNLTTLRALALDGLSTAKACRSPILSSVLPQVHSYSLSRGAIHGSIPKCLFGMPELRTLHLSGNGLGGSIPVKEESDLGPHLSDLSLSHNGLSGSLPGPLRGGSRWVSLDVSYNKLKGELQLEDEDEDGDGNKEDEDEDVGSEEAEEETEDSSSSTSSSDGEGGFSPQASVYLNINRLSGRIPGFYYEIGEGSSGSGGEVNMLRGNLFACPERDLENDVPESDPYRLQYGCGSDDLNSALLVWTGLLFVFGLLLFVVYFVKREKKQRSVVKIGVVGGEVGEGEMKSPSSLSSSCLACSCSSSSSWYEWLYNQLQSYYLFIRLEEWQEDLRQWHESEWLGCVSGVDGKSVSEEVFQTVSRVWRSFYRQLAAASGREVGRRGGGRRRREHTVEKKRAMLLNILQAGKSLHEVRWCVFWLVVVMVCVGGSVYGSLTVFYGSYDNEYAWTLSAAYLSGVGASGVLVAYFVCLLCVSGGMWLRGVRSMLWYLSGRLDEASGEVEITSEAVLRGRDGSVSVEEGGKRGSLIRVVERCCLQCDGAGADAFIQNEMGGGREGNASTAKDEQKQQDEEKDSRKKRSKVDWRAVLAMKVCIAVVNIFIVLVVNGFYVYIYLQLQRWSAMMLSVALSVFKVCWSMVVQVGVVKLLQPLQHHEEEEEEGEERSGEEGGRGESMMIRTRGMRREGLHEENVRFMSSLMLFNTIVAPCLATMVASSDCFYYVFASPDTITASYSFQECAEFAGVGCLVYQTTTHSIDFSPPFSYTYQCSSAMLVDYAYVFAYKYVLIGILYPVFVLGVVLYVDWCRSKEKEKKMSQVKGEQEVENGEENKMVVGMNDLEAGVNDHGSQAASPFVTGSLVWVEMFLPMLWRMEGDMGVPTRGTGGVLGNDVGSVGGSVGKGEGVAVENPMVIKSVRDDDMLMVGNARGEGGECGLEGESKGVRRVVEEVCVGVAEERYGKDMNSSHSIGTSPSSLLPSSSSSVSSRSSSLCFSSGDYVIRVTMMVGCLLTFGAVLPYLSILIGFSIASNTYLTQLGWLRVLERCLCREGGESESEGDCESGLGKEEVEGKARQGVCEGVKAGEGKEVDNRVLEEKEEGEESVVEEASVSVREERQEGKMKVDGDCYDDGEEEKACEEVDKSVSGEGVLVGDEGVRRGKLESQGKSMVKEKENGMEKLLLELGGECGRLGSSLMRAGQPLLFLVPLFYAGYVFDPAGDEGGWLWGLYLALSLLGVLLLMVLLGGGVWLWFSSVHGLQQGKQGSLEESTLLFWKWSVWHGFTKSGERKRDEIVDGQSESQRGVFNGCSVAKNVNKDIEMSSSVQTQSSQ